jgi:hypothetical protein
LAIIGGTAIGTFATAAFFAGKAFGEEQEITFSEDENGVTVRYYNELTQWNAVNEQVYTFESTRGPVSFLLHRTQNNSCVPMPCADRLEVVDLPEGTVAVPAEVNLPELGITTVRVIRFEGL